MAELGVDVDARVFDMIYTNLAGSMDHSMQGLRYSQSRWVSYLGTNPINLSRISLIAHESYGHATC